MAISLHRYCIIFGLSLLPLATLAQQSPDPQKAAAQGNDLMPKVKDSFKVFLGKSKEDVQSMFRFCRPMADPQKPDPRSLQYDCNSEISIFTLDEFKVVNRQMLMLKLLPNEKLDEMEKGVVATLKEEGWVFARTEPKQKNAQVYTHPAWPQYILSLAAMPERGIMMAVGEEKLIFGQ